MSVSLGFRSATSLGVAAFAAVIAFGSPAFAQAQPDATAEKVTPCVAPTELTRLMVPLARTSRKLAGGDPITIVAIGSSSTAGAGASSPDKSYPSRLEVELKALYPRIAFKVINRGANGETAKEMVARFDEVIADKPDVVIWQVGSNSVLRDQPIEPALELVREGLRTLKAAGADVILMNPQYAPKVNVKADAERMVDRIDALAKETHVDLFQRFAVMRYWRLTENIPFEIFLSPDELHMNDWSYGCVARLLAGSIGEAANRSTLTATAGARR